MPNVVFPCAALVDRERRPADHLLRGGRHRRPAWPTATSRRSWSSRRSMNAAQTRPPPRRAGRKSQSHLGPEHLDRDHRRLRPAGGDRIGRQPPIPPGRADPPARRRRVRRGPGRAGGRRESHPSRRATTLLTFKGTGPMTSDPFNSSGESVDVTYEYTCSEDASFTLNFYGTYDSPLLPDVLVSEFGASGSGTATESLNGTTGPFTVEVDSPCDWSIEVARHALTRPRRHGPGPVPPPTERRAPRSRSGRPLPAHFPPGPDRHGPRRWPARSPGRGRTSRPTGRVPGRTGRSARRRGAGPPR